MKILETELAKFFSAAELLKLPDILIERLRYPEQVFIDFLPVERQDNDPLTIYCRLTHHSRLRGPAKGGLKMAAVDTREEADTEIDALAMMMSWKTGVINLPYGGMKGGAFLIKSDSREGKPEGPCEFPNNLTLKEREAFFKHWTYRLKSKGAIGPERGIPAPDQKTGPREMAWMKAAYNVDGSITSSAVTGKPVEIGGSYGREDATGAGVFYIISDCLAPKFRFSLKNLSVAIQGFGNVGDPLAKFLHAAGVKIIAISDILGGIKNEEDGIDPFLASKIKNEGGKEGLRAYTKIHPAEFITNEELLELECDLLIPAATQNQIHAKNAERIRAKIAIVEAANSPVTGEASRILLPKGIRIVPGILANAGGVTVSYLEWVQDLQSYFFEESVVHQILRKKLVEAFEAVWSIHEGLGLSLEEAAMSLGVARVAQAAWWQGKDVPPSWQPNFPPPIEVLAGNQKTVNVTISREREKIQNLIKISP